MFNRTIQPHLLECSKKYPVVGLLGPRQSGKTTLVKNCFRDKPYINLEAPDVRLLAETDPRALLDQYPNGCIFDEIQKLPMLLSYIQVYVDQQQKNGLYILTGSHQLDLHAAISQSLAGRVALLTLLPMTLSELSEEGYSSSVDKQMLYGFYPRIFQEDLTPYSAYQNYVKTYLEKDIRQISEIRNLIQFQNFIKLCAGRIGKIIEYTQFSNEIGVAVNTIKHWFSALEASYIIFRLPPYFENFGKRITKSSKLYFTDVGLASYLLGIENIIQMSRDPLRGFLFENLVILELLKYRLNRGLDANLYFFRDHHGNEVDVVIQHGRELIPIEIKSAKTYSSIFLKSLKYFQAISQHKVTKSFIIYTGDFSQSIHETKLINYRDLEKIYTDDN